MKIKLDTNILLVWEKIPDSIRVYLIPTDHPMAANVIASHGIYINGDKTKEGDPVRLVNAWLEPIYNEDPVEIAPSQAEPFLLIKGRGEEKKINLSVARISALVVSGCFL